MFVAIARFPTIPPNGKTSSRRGSPGPTTSFARSTDSKADDCCAPRTGRTWHSWSTRPLRRSTRCTPPKRPPDAHARLGDVIIDEPRATKYEVVVDFAKSEACCGGGGGHGDQGALDRTGVGIGGGLQVAGGCCRGA